ncbi:unnamed protein product, partial [marine sediment metagenome]
TSSFNPNYHFAIHANNKATTSNLMLLLIIICF